MQVDVLLKEKDRDFIIRFYAPGSLIGTFGSLKDLSDLIETGKSLSFWGWDSDAWSNYFDVYEELNNRTIEDEIVYRLGKHIEQIKVRDKNDEIERITLILVILKRLRQFYVFRQTGMSIMYEH